MRRRTDAVGDPREGSGGGVVLGLLVLLALVFGGLYVAGYVVAGDRVPRNASVAGVQIGGMRPAAAERTLRAGLSSQASAPMTVRVQDEERQVSPRDLGLSIDYARTVAEAGAGRSWRPQRIWDFFLGGTSHHPAVDVDRPRLRAAVARLGRGVDHPAEEGRIEFRHGRPAPVYPRDGVEVSAAGSRSVLTANYLTDAVSDLPLVAVDPSITHRDIDRALHAFARPAMSAPLEVRIGRSHGGATVELTPRQLSPALLMVPGSGKLVPTVRSEQVTQAVNEAAKGSALHPVNARFRFRHGRPDIVPSKRGLTYDPDVLSHRLVPALTRHGKHRRVRVPGVVQRPAFTTRDARGLGVRRPVATVTSRYAFGTEVTIDVGRAAKLLQATLVRPGETFSMMGSIGDRTADNGFSHQARGGRRVPPSTEDGLSQVATDLFRAGWSAGLEDTEHQPPLHWAGRFPPGLEASVTQAGSDLRFTNDTHHGVLIQTVADPGRPHGRLTVRLWSVRTRTTTVSRGPRRHVLRPVTVRHSGKHCSPQPGRPGFDIDVRRRVHSPGAATRTDRIHTSYAVQDHVVCGSGH